MITPKELEAMYRVETDWWVLRFWVTAQSASLTQEQVADVHRSTRHKIAEFVSSIELNKYRVAAEVLNHLNHSFDSTDMISAAEVIDRRGLPGLVAYYEWP
jgi:hypothetical protein